MTRRVKTKTCVVCGAKFECNTTRMTCSDACRKARKQAMDAKARHGKGRVGTTEVCPTCGKPFVVTGTTQRYCTERCAYRARAAAVNENNIKSTCVVCGKQFLTSRNTKARTCGKACASALRGRKIRESAQRAFEAARPAPGPWQHDMRCPWEHCLFDTPPAYGVSWYGAGADPMTRGAWGCDAVETRERRVAA